MPAVKHIPQRTCIACRVVKPKKEMIRLVNTGVNGIQLDRQGRQAGRGAYLCRLPDCWETGINGSKLERALRGTLTADSRQRLVYELKELCGGQAR